MNIYNFARNMVLSYLAFNNGCNRVLKDPLLPKCISPTNVDTTDDKLSDLWNNLKRFTDFNACSKIPLTSKNFETVLGAATVDLIIAFPLTIIAERATLKVGAMALTSIERAIPDVVVRTLASTTIFVLQRLNVNSTSHIEF